jgi:hypothetical protein
MTSSALALQQAIVGELAADPGVLAALSGPRIYDDTPQPAAFPYVTIGQTTARSADADLEPADEHILTLHVWSRARGRREALAIIDEMRRALHDRPLALADHKLINLRHEFSEARRDRDGETIHGLVRFRAVTEPL